MQKILHFSFYLSHTCVHWNKNHCLEFLLEWIANKTAFLFANFIKKSSSYLLQDFLLVSQRIYHERIFKTIKHKSIFSVFGKIKSLNARNIKVVDRLVFVEPFTIQFCWNVAVCRCIWYTIIGGGGFPKCNLLKKKISLSLSLPLSFSVFLVLLCLSRSLCFSLLEKQKKY